MRTYVAAGLILSATLAFGSTAGPNAATTGVRSLFLNGVDISSARGQDLKNVDMHINDAGDVFIIAPHYQVNEEDTYVPLSKYVQGLNAPEHKAPAKVGDEAKAGGTARPVEMVPSKADEPVVSPPAAKAQVLPEHAKLGGKPSLQPDLKPAAAEPPGTSEAAPEVAPSPGEVPKAGDPLPADFGEKG